MKHVYWPVPSYCTTSKQASLAMIGSGLHFRNYKLPQTRKPVASTPFVLNSYGLSVVMMRWRHVRGIVRWITLEYRFFVAGLVLWAQSLKMPLVNPLLLNLTLHWANFLKLLFPLYQALHPQIPRLNSLALLLSLPSVALDRLKSTLRY